MAATWTQIIKDEIGKELRRYSLHEKFIGRYKLREIWRTAFQTQPAGEPARDVSQIRDWAIGTQEDQSLLILASILVYIDWDDWFNFATAFTDGQGRARHQLPLDEETAHTLLGSKGSNFCISQPIFLPVTFVQGENLHFTEYDRLPFVETACKTSAAVSGTVTKIVIERGYFKDSNGDTIQQQRTLARKRFHYPQDYATEIRFLNEIRQNLRQHSHVLAHMSTLAVGRNDFSILSEFADRGDLQQFLASSSTAWRSHRDRIIEETAKIADALDFLHKGFHVDGVDRPCYHLDLKPANVLVFSRRRYPPEKRDDVGEWAITDFGVSVFHERTAEGVSTTFPRREAGTYQPPEIDDRLGSPRVNAKGDIWSLGGILCMVLAFLVDGSRGVEEHTRRRSRTAVGLQEQDFYYEIQRHPHNSRVSARAIFKPKIQEWLTEIHESSADADWITCIIGLIRACLSVDEHERPDAIQVYKSLLQPQGHHEERIATVSRQSTLSLSPVATSNDSPPSSSTIKGLVARLTGRRTSRPSISKNAKPPLIAEIRTPSLGSSDHTSPPSIASAPDLEYTSGSAALVQRGNAQDVAIDLDGRHAILCFPQETLIFDLVPDPRQHSVPMPGSFNYINLAGQYMILYEKSTLQPTFQCLEEGMDPSFGKLAEQSARFRTALKTAVSARGEVAVMQNRTMRAPRHISSEFPMPSKQLGKEVFKAISFDRTGLRLWACGSRHWFMWTVDADLPGWLLRPRIGAFAQQDWSAIEPSIFVFTHRSAICVYDEKTWTLRLFDATQKTSSQVPLDTALLCGIIGCRDDQIFYLRLSRSPPQPCLYRRIIQGMKIGPEELVAELPGLNPRAKFAIACREEASAQVLVIISTQGEFQSHRLEFEASNQPA